MSETFLLSIWIVRTGCAVPSEELFLKEIENSCLTTVVSSHDSYMLCRCIQYNQHVSGNRGAVIQKEIQCEVWAVTKCEATLPIHQSTLGIHSLLHLLISPLLPMA